MPPGTLEPLPSLQAPMPVLSLEDPAYRQAEAPCGALAAESGSIPGCRGIGTRPGRDPTAQDRAHPRRCGHRAGTAATVSPSSGCAPALPIQIDPRLPERVGHALQLPDGPTRHRRPRAMAQGGQRALRLAYFRSLTVTTAQ
jgi:hypothetical protein